MISERKLASGFASLWHEVTPMADTYWRTQNLYTTHFARPIENIVNPQLRAFTSELAFETFFQQRDNSFVSRQGARALAITCAPRVVTYISRFADGIVPAVASEEEAAIEEALTLLNRLTMYFGEVEARKPLTIRPSFPGCGIVNDCQGDVVAGNTLYEVKAVDRGFRITDLRQLIIYAALGRSSRAFRFERLGLLNPRTSQCWVRDVDEISYAIAGTSGVELLDAVVEAISSPSAETQ